MLTSCDCGTAHKPGCPFYPKYGCEVTYAPSVSPPIYGWVCPVCHGGLSPFIFRCPCTPAEPVGMPITTTTTSTGETNND